MKWVQFRDTFLVLFFYTALATLAAGGPGRFFSMLAGPVFLMIVALTILSERAARPAHTRGKLKDAGTAKPLAWTMILIPTVALLDHYWLQSRLHPLDWSRGWLATGVTLAALGTIIRIIAIKKLGAFFSRSIRIDDEHVIVRDGIYTHIRHPAYTGLLLVWSGYVSLFASLWAYLALLLLLLPALVHRIKKEEATLMESLEGDYRAYCARTWRLVPYLY